MYSVTTTQQVTKTTITSITAPGKVFATRAELADHYRSDWHKYNLRRRDAGLPLLLEPDFMARVEAAQSLRKQAQDASNGGKSHLKNKKQQKSKNKDEATPKSQGHTDSIAQEQQNVEPRAESSHVQSKEEEETEDEEQINEIDPRQCLFDRHMSVSVQANVDRMYRKYGFFLPDREYLTDLTGLIGFCHEKIKLGHTCLYCQRVFATYTACQKHMISKRHTKLLYEAGVDFEDVAVFYNFANVDGVDQEVSQDNVKVLTKPLERCDCENSQNVCDN